MLTQTEHIPAGLWNYKTHINMEVSKSELPGTFYNGRHMDWKVVSKNEYLQSNIRE